MTEVTNIHGRRAGRGLRPWLLIPKIVCVSVALGAAVSSLVLWLGRQSAAGLDVVDPLHVLLGHVMVPALAAALFFGGLLLLQHPGIFLRQRWLQAKLALASVAFPALHLQGTMEMDRLRTWLIPIETTPPRHGLAVILVLACVVLLALIVLGRLKPRLRQNWALAYRGTSELPRT